METGRQIEKTQLSRRGRRTTVRQQTGKGRRALGFLIRDTSLGHLTLDTVVDPPPILCIWLSTGYQDKLVGIGVWGGGHE